MAASSRRRADALAKLAATERPVDTVLSTWRRWPSEARLARTPLAECSRWRLRASSSGVRSFCRDLEAERRGRLLSPLCLPMRTNSELCDPRASVLGSARIRPTRFPNVKRATVGRKVRGAAREKQQTQQSAPDRRSRPWPQRALRLASRLAGKDPNSKHRQRHEYQIALRRASGRLL